MIYKWRIDGKWIDDIGINWDTISFQLPISRYFDLIPFGYIVVILVKKLRPLSWLFDPIELPMAI